MPVRVGVDESSRGILLVMRRIDLPIELGEVFAVSHARALGVSAGHLRSRKLDRPFRGVRRNATSTRGTLTPEERHLQRACAYALRMTEHEFFSHVTAAVIWGIPLPPSAVDVDLIDVAVLAPRRNPRGDGVRGHEVEPRLVSARIHPGTVLRVASAASTWAMLGSRLRDPYDLVAAGDAVVREPWHPDHPPSHGSLAQVTAAVAAGRRVGVRALREALPRLRTRSASRPETWLRLILVHDGLPEPMLNHPVFEDDGAFIGFVDQAYPALKIAVEYEGEHHLLDAGQWAKDIARYDRLAEAGWRVIRVTKHEVFSAPHLIAARVRRAIRVASGGSSLLARSEAPRYW